MPTPEQILKGIKREASRIGQGRLKIYLGMVAGVGKTYAMLKYAHQMRAKGVDVVVGYVETHGRVETIAQIDELEVLPRLKLNYRDVEVEEFDLDLALKRRPQLVLVDELAHTNATGSRHPKRYQDVLELLNQGIDVHTTLNVQHLQSRSDTVSRITGVTIQEIVPDSLIDRADDIVFIDQDPDEVIDRLQQGKIYAPEKAEVAAKNFFKPGNLTALRELGLRLMAERVDHELSALKSLQGDSSGTRPHHHLVVAVFASPYSEYLIRWTRRHAYGLNCTWSAVYVRSSRPLSDEEEALLRKNLETVKDLGGEVIEIQDDDIVQGILRGVRQQEATQLVVGKPRDRRWWNFWKSPLTHNLIYGQTHVDVHVVAPPEQTLKLSKIPSQRAWKWQLPSSQAWFSSLLVVGGATLLNLGLLDFVAYHALGLIYMLSFCLAAIFLRHFSVSIAALCSAILWNFVFIPPRFTFAISAGEDWLMLLLYLVTSAVIGTFTRQLRISEVRLRHQGERTDSLYRLTRTLAAARDASEAIHLALEQINLELKINASVWVLEGKRRIEEARQQGNFSPNDKDWAALQWAFLNRKPAGRFTDTLPSVSGHYIPLIDQTGAWGILGLNTQKLTEMSTESFALVHAISQQLALSLGRDDLFRQLQSRQIKEESEKIYKTLLNSVSHELRTPITAISGFAEALITRGSTDPQISEMAREISNNTQRLDQVVQNFLDMGRIESGQFKLQKVETDLEELIRGVWNKLKPLTKNHQINFRFPLTPCVLALDSILVAQALENILKNTLLYTPQESTIEINLTNDTRWAKIIISDNGPGLGINPEQVFEKFWRGNPGKTGGTGLGLSIARAFIELHNGQLTADNIRSGGAVFKISLPTKD